MIYPIPNYQYSSPNCCYYYFITPLIQNYQPTPALIAYSANLHQQYQIIHQELKTQASRNNVDKKTHVLKERQMGEKKESFKNEKIPLKKGSQNRIKYQNTPKTSAKEIKLDFRTDWKNENRNIVPNILNQMLSFLLKKRKSQTSVMRLFESPSCPSPCSINRFYQYMKGIKDSISHYISQGIIQLFLQIHEPKCEIYTEDEQFFYMKICRILIRKFLTGDAVLIVLTSRRMSEGKRMAHLIARDALLRKFLELSESLA